MKLEQQPFYKQYMQMQQMKKALEARTAAPTAPVPTAPAPAAPTGDLWSQYQPELKQATQQQEQLLKDYYAMSAQGPTFAQNLLDSIKQAGLYPSHAEMRAEYMKNPNLTPSAIEGLVSRRGQTGRGSIQDLISRATGGFEADIESRRGAAEFAQQRRANILEEYGLEYKSEQDALDRIKAGRGSDAKRARDSAKRQAELDASRGATSEQLARAYGSVLEPWEILQTYNDTNFYGAPIENLTEQFYKWLPGYGDDSKEAWESLIPGLREDIAAGFSYTEILDAYPEIPVTEINRYFTSYQREAGG